MPIENLSSYKRENISIKPSIKKILSDYQGVFLFLLLYFITWTVLPIYLDQSVALDVSEGVNWGHEWQMGYYKHPPLSSWILYSTYRLAGYWGINFLTEICVFSSVYLIYRLGCLMMSKQRALLGSLLLFLTSYYSYPSTEFNHNVAQLPIWAGLSYLFYQALTNKEKNWRYWIAVGLLGGLGMLTKYHVAFILLSMALYLLLPKQIGRAHV